MAKQHLLLVAHDAQALRLMEVSLRQAGFVTTTAKDGVEALSRLETLRPALVIADADMPGLDGYDLCVHLKADPRYAEIPFILLADEGSADARIRGLELGADDALTRPIYTRELITRVRMALEREKRRSLSSQHRFFGDLADMSVIDLLQTIEIGGKSGRARITSEGRQGTLWFDGGLVADAEAGGLTGEEAVYRLLTWDIGTFEMDFRGAPRARTVEGSTSALLMEGVRRMDEWSRVAEQLPGLDLPLRVDDAELTEQDLTPQAREIIRLFDGYRSIRAVVDAAALPDLDALRLICRLYLEGVLVAPGQAAASRVVTLPVEEGIELLEPDWMEEPAPVAPVAPAPTAPSSAPPPRVTGGIARIDPQNRRSRGLVDDLIRSAANLPVLPREVVAAAREAAQDVSRPISRDVIPRDPAPRDVPREVVSREAMSPGRPTPPEARPDLPITRRERPVPPSALRAAEERAPRGAIDEQRSPDEHTLRGPAEEERPREPTPVMAPQPPPAFDRRVTADLTRQAEEAKEVELRVLAALRQPTPPVPPLTAPTIPPERLRQPLETEEDLLLARGNARARWVAAVFVLAILGAGAVWFLRDQVVPFAGRVDGPRVGWHKGVLSSRPAVGAAAPISADIRLPAGGALVAPGSAAPDSAAPDSAAPGSAAPDSAAPVAPSVGSAAPGSATLDAPESMAAPAEDEFGRLLSSGLDLNKKGRYGQAAGSLAKAVKLRPDHVDARLALARARLEAGSDDAALVEAQKVIARKADAAEAWLIAGTVHQLKNRKKEAAEAYQRYLQLAPSGPSAGELRNILPTLQAPAGP